MTKRIVLKIVGILSVLLLSCADYNTLNETMNPASVELSIISVADSTVTLSWTKYPGTDFKNYTVYYSQGSVVEKNDSLADSLSYQFDTLLTVRKLARGTKFYFRVMTNTINNVFSASNIVDTIPGSVNNGNTVKSVMVHFGNIADTSVALVWSKYTGNDFKNYVVRYSQNDNVKATDSLGDSLFFQSDTSKIVRKLVAGNRYYFRVWTNTINNDFSVSDIVDTVTNWPAIVKPVVGHIGKTTDDTITIVWSKYRVGDFRNYTVYMSPDNIVDTTDTVVFRSQSQDSISQADTSVTIGKLQSETHYYFKICVNSITGKMGMSAAIDTTTLMRTKGVFELDTPKVNADSSLTLSWSVCPVKFDTYKIMADTMSRDSLIFKIGLDQTKNTAIIRDIANQKFLKGHSYYFQIFSYRNKIEVAKSNQIAITP